MAGALRARTGLGSSPFFGTGAAGRLKTLQMAGRAVSLVTDSEDASDAPDESDTDKLIHKPRTAGSPDPEDEDDAGFNLAQKRRRHRCEWETIETWDRDCTEDEHIMNCILNNARE